MSTLEAIEATLGLSGTAPTSDLFARERATTSSNHTSPALTLRQTITSPRVESSVMSARSVRSDDWTQMMVPTASMSSEISLRQMEWDKEAASADQKQAELFHLQWSLFRDQISTFSSEMITMRRDIQNLQSAQTQQRKTFEDAVAKQEKTTARTDTSLRSLEDRLNNALQDFRRQLALLQDTLEADRREHTSNEDRARKKIVELVQGLDEERAQRLAACDVVERDLHRLKSSFEDEGRKRTIRDSEVNAAMDKISQAQNAIEITVQSLVTDLNSRFEEEVRARSAGDHQQERSLEELRHELRVGIEAETNSKKAELSGVQNSLKTFRTSLDQEIVDRTRGDEHNTEAFHKLQASLEKEIKERMSASDAYAANLKDVLRALEKERQERAEGIGNLRQALSESKARMADIDDCRKMLGKLRSAIEQQDSTRIEDYERLAKELHDSSKISFDNIATLRQDVTNMSIRLETEVAERGRANLHVEKVLAEFSDALRCDREALSDRVTALQETLPQIKTQLQLQVDSESSARSDGINELSESMKSLRHEFASEVKEHRLGLETELLQISNQSKVLIEKETRDLQTMRAETELHIQELVSSVEREVNERASGEHGLRGQLAGFREELLTSISVEKESRSHEMLSLHHSLQNGLEETTHQLQLEKKDRLQVVERLDQQSSDLATKLNRCGIDVAEAQGSLASLKHKIEEENKERIIGDEEVARMALQAKQLAEKESQDRHVAEEDLAKKMQSFADSLREESSKREGADSSLRGQLANCVQDLKEEQAERKNAEHGIVEQIRDLRIHLEKCQNQLRVDAESLQASTTQLRLEKEGRTRAIDDISEQLRTLSVSFQAESKARSSGDTDLSQKQQDAKDALESQRAFLQDEINQVLKAVVTESEARVARDEENQRKMQEISRSLDLEVRERVRGDEESAASCLEVKHAVEKEVSERRATGDTLNRALEELRAAMEQGLAGERAEFANTHRELKNLAQDFGNEVTECRATEQQLESALNSFKIEIVQRLEASVRSLDTQLENLSASLSVSLSAETRDRCAGDEACLSQLANIQDQRLHERLNEMKNEFRTRIDELSANLQSEVTARDSEIGSLGDASRSLQAKLHEEARQRADELAEALRSVQERLRGFNAEHFKEIEMRLDEEIKAREQGDELEGKLLQSLRTSLELEITERSQGMTDAFEKIRLLRSPDNAGQSSQLQVLDVLRTRIDVAEDTMAHITTSTSDLETRMQKSQSSLENELSRLWEAMDTHTHDVEIDSDEEAKQSKTIQYSSVVTDSSTVTEISQQSQKYAGEKSALQNVAVLNSPPKASPHPGLLSRTRQSITTTPSELLTSARQVRIERQASDASIPAIPPIGISMQQAQTSGYRSAPTPGPFPAPACMQPALHQNVGVSGLTPSIKITKVRSTTPEPIRHSMGTSFSSFPPVHLQAKPLGQPAVQSIPHFVAAQTPRSGNSLSARPHRSSSATSLTREVNESLVVARSQVQAESSIGRSSMQAEFVEQTEMSTQNKEKPHTARYHIEAGGSVHEPHKHPSWVKE